MKSNIIYVLALLLLFASGCEKDRLTYIGETNKESGIYFYYPNLFDGAGNPISYRDSILFGFENDPQSITQKVYNVPVKVLGSIVDQDRIFKVKVAGGTAIEGQDFEKLEVEYTVLAGKATASIPLKMLRTPRLLHESIYVDLELIESNDFKLLLPIMVNKANLQEMDATKFRVRFSEIIHEPSHWVTYSPNFWGLWSIKKFKLLNELMEWKTSDWERAGLPGSPVIFGKYPYSSIILQKYLQDRADRKEPVYEDDGVTLMQLSERYAVDYSKL